MILLAGIAELSYDVRQTRTLSGTMIAGSRGFIGAEDVASAVPTVLSKGVPVEARFADLAIAAVGVVQALQAVTGVRIAVAGTTQVRVVATVAQLTATARYFGIAKVILGAVLASWSSVSLETLANHILR